MTPAAPPLTLRELAELHGLGLTRFAYLMCGDHARAEDLVQEVFLAMHRVFGDTVAVAAPVAYARRAIVNANISWSRSASSRDLLIDELPERGRSDPEPADGELWALVHRLPSRQRAVLVLRYHLGCTDGEIAHLLDCRRGTVRSLASRALAQLRESLSPEAPSPERSAS